MLAGGSGQAGHSLELIGPVLRMTMPHLVYITLAAASSIETDAHPHLPIRGIAKSESVFLQVQQAYLELS